MKVSKLCVVILALTLLSLLLTANAFAATLVVTGPNASQTTTPVPSTPIVLSTKTSANPIDFGVDQNGLGTLGGTIFNITALGDPGAAGDATLSIKMVRVPTAIFPSDYVAIRWVNSAAGAGKYDIFIDRPNAQPYFQPLGPAITNWLTGPNYPTMARGNIPGVPNPIPDLILSGTSGVHPTVGGNPQYRFTMQYIPSQTVAIDLVAGTVSAQGTSMYHSGKLKVWIQESRLGNATTPITVETMNVDAATPPKPTATPAGYNFYQDAFIPILGRNANGSAWTPTVIANPGVNTVNGWLVPTLTPPANAAAGTGGANLPVGQILNNPLGPQILPLWSIPPPPTQTGGGVVWTLSLGQNVQVQFLAELKHGPATPIGVESVVDTVTVPTPIFDAATMALSNGPTDLFAAETGTNRTAISVQVNNTGSRTWKCNPTLHSGTALDHINLVNVAASLPGHILSSPPALTAIYTDIDHRSKAVNVDVGPGGSFTTAFSLVAPGGQPITPAVPTASAMIDSGFQLQKVTIAGGVSTTLAFPDSAVTGAQFSVNVTQFQDVHLTDNFRTHIELLGTAGVTKGAQLWNPVTKAAPLYLPNNNVTRKEMAAFLGRALQAWRNPLNGAKQSVGGVPTFVPWFTDDFRNFHAYTPTDPGYFVDPDLVVTGGVITPLTDWVYAISNPVWGAGDSGAPIATMADLNPITNGCLATPRTYCSNDPVTRAQMAAFIRRAFAIPQQTPPAPTFTDVHGTPNNPDGTVDTAFSPLWADVEGIASLSLQPYPVTRGTSATTFSPGALVSRSQMAAFLVRAGLKPSPEPGQSTTQQSFPEIGGALKANGGLAQYPALPAVPGAPGTPYQTIGPILGGMPPYTVTWQAVQVHKVAGILTADLVSHTAWKANLDAAGNPVPALVSGITFPDPNNKIRPILNPPVTTGYIVTVTDQQGASVTAYSKASPWPAGGTYSNTTAGGTGTSDPAGKPNDLSCVVVVAPDTLGN